MSAAGAIALALLASGGGSWSCSVAERIDPQTIAVFRSTPSEGGAADLPSFHVSYIAEGEQVISQQMGWYHVPRDNQRLGTPDLIAFSMPIPKPDRNGLLSFRTDGLRWSVRQEARTIRPLAGFGSSWVEFQGWIERNRFWSGSAWTVEAIDRRMRTMGVTEIRLPGPDRLQAAYERLRVELARFESDPAKHCEYYPPPQPTEEEIIVSGTPDPA